MFPRDLDQEVLVHSSFPFRYSQLSEFTAQVQGRIKAKKLLGKCHFLMGGLLQSAFIVCTMCNYCCTHSSLAFVNTRGAY